MSTLPIENVLTLPINRLGRDFLIGDVSGEFEAVFRNMRKLNFDQAKDRLFSVGHLISPSASMTQCIRFIRHPGVYAVRTNTEQQLLDLFDEGEPDDDAWQVLAEGNGNGWMQAAGRVQRLQIVESMRMLPLAVAVGERQLQAAFVHGAIPGAMGWREFAGGLVRDDEECVAAALWGSPDIHARPVAEVSEIFVCYTPDWNLGYERVNIRQVMPGTALQLLSQGTVSASMKSKGSM